MDYATLNQLENALFRLQAICGAYGASDAARPELDLLFSIVKYERNESEKKGGKQ